MELYILDDQFRRVTVIDRFESLIWTERFQESGDFELIVAATREMRNLLQVNTNLAVNTSYRCMTIRQVEDTKDEEGRQTLTVTGPSFESVLADRVTKNTLAGTSAGTNKGETSFSSATDLATTNAHGLITGDPIFFTGTIAAPLEVETIYYAIVVSDNTYYISDTLDNAVNGIYIDLTNNGGPGGSGKTLFWADGGRWRLKGKPADIVREIFNHICVTGALDPSDIIPYITAGNIFPPDTIPEPDTEITLDVQADSLYEIIRTICEGYDLGFRLIRNFDESELYFNVYAGSDRTTLQSVLPPVIFAPELDNLSDTTLLTSNVDMKNVAYVVAPHGYQIVYAEGSSESTSGLDRRVLMVDANDITLPAGTELNTALQQKGREELAAHRSLFAFDGQVPQFGSYKYQTHYSLGDLVEMRNIDGVTNNMRVTEQITVHDRQGERSYPTLSTELIITPGSWFAWDANQVWNDFDDEVWDDF